MTSTPAPPDFSDLYRSLGLSGSGCTEAELDTLEQEAGVHLPKAYADFLRVNGVIPDEAFKGSDCSLDTLIDLQGAAEALLVESGTEYALPHNAFVFLMHQGYQFFFFEAAETPADPPVLYYMEGEKEPRCSNPSFTHWLEEYIRSVRDVGGAG
jgi:hypothetical protein